MTTSKQRRRYEPAFKKDAVHLWRSGNRGAYEVARELGISVAALYSWASEAKLDATVGVLPSSNPGQRGLRVENARLRAEIEKLRVEREVLKKTLAILAEPHKSNQGSGTESEKSD